MRPARTIWISEVGQTGVMREKSWMRAGDDERPEGSSHVGSRLTSRDGFAPGRRPRALRLRRTLSALRGLTAPPRRKVGNDVVNGLSLSLAHLALRRRHRRAWKKDDAAAKFPA